MPLALANPAGEAVVAEPHRGGGLSTEGAGLRVGLSLAGLGGVGGSLCCHALIMGHGCVEVK